MAPSFDLSFLRLKSRRTQTILDQLIVSGSNFATGIVLVRGLGLSDFGKFTVGYAIVFETYSSFLALPTLYLEDIFVLSEYRRHGIGLKLFRYCCAEARRRGCGRMEWVVLDWNKSAIRFYNRLGAKRMKEWQLYRLHLWS